MKIIFFGSGKFAVKILDTLCRSRHQVVLVVTQPDRKKGRHLHLAATPVKEYALGHKFELFQPEDINSPESAAFLKVKAADVFVVVSYGRILSQEILDIPLKIPVNIHASLLPKYRGAAPINRALMAGDRKTGVTFIRMNARMDEGDILFGRSIRIDAGDDAVSLDDKLSSLAAGALERVLRSIEKHGPRLKKQKQNAATLAPLMKKHDGLIVWARPVQSIMNQHRGCAGWPGTYTVFRGKILKIIAMKKGRPFVRHNAGQILKAGPDVLEVACGRGSVLITEVIPESHKKMDIRSFLAGHKVEMGEILG